jgi:hypothetical protein
MTGEGIEHIAGLRECLGQLPVARARLDRADNGEYGASESLPFFRSVAMPANSESPTCQSCGACCSYSRDWPRFTTEDDADLDMIPPSLVDAGLAGMRCEGDRCAALVGDVGTSTSCSIYRLRPDVCRACMPGDHACQVARKSFGLARWI